MNAGITQQCPLEGLDAVLRDSASVNQPDSHGIFWASFRERIPREELDEMNEFRRCVGLPDA